MNEDLFIEGIDFPSQSFDSDETIYFDEATLKAQEAFGIKYLFPWQRLVISNILDSFNSLNKNDSFFIEETGEDNIFCTKQIVLLPTGAGKSLCFLTPALVLPGITLVIYPLLALMADQERRMNEGGIECAVLKGGLTESEQNTIFEKISSGKVKVVLANPEILQSQKVMQILKKADISHIALDEAHCVCEWGDSFRPSYLTLGQTIKKLGVEVVTAFTATASPTVLKRISEVLFDGNARLVQSSADRENIHYEVRYAYCKSKEVLRSCVEFKKPLIVFCSSRKRTEDTARLLASYFGYKKVKFYHAGLTKEEKTSVEKWFFESTDGILTATCAYGMGMDKSNIYTVIHLDAPEHIENFIQEAGRAGRKGDNVNSVLIWNHFDDVRHRQAEENSREKVMGDFVHTKNCRRSFMLNYLSGENVSCSGCDICDAKKEGKTVRRSAEDAEIALKIIKKKRKLYTKDEITNLLTQKLNEKDFDFFRTNIWEAKDSQTILSQLFSQKKIRKLSGLWENHIDINYSKKNLRKFFKLKTIHRFFLFRKKFRYWKNYYLKVLEMFV